MTDLESKWPAQEPQASFADRVVTAAMAEASPRRWPWFAAGAVALAAGIALWLATRPAVASGEVRADRRIEVDLGGRAVAVLEPGAHVRWRGDSVEQDRGSVFYRVERGASFVVHTPMADATVLGTCFRINVNDKENAMIGRDFGAGLVGALAATGVLVGVYEGKVRVSHAQQDVTVTAGETAIADSGGVRRADTQAASIEHATAVQLRARLAALEQEKATLEHELAAGHAASAKSPYDLAADDWAKMAEKGEFKYQLPCFQHDGYRPTTAQLDKLGLTPGDADAIQAAYRHANQQFGTDMSAICGSNSESDVSSCISGLFRNLYTDGADSAKLAYTEVDEIRAGKRPMPPLAEQSQSLRMLLLFSEGMNGFEAELAQTFGADKAHEIAYADDLCFMANSF
ncbi:MAG TPA: hypothetical protein VMJ10_08955 [Kofleriaceae bacterium]|nr:hypothetical protein [Kofleriaceae bacterium]